MPVCHGCDVGKCGVRRVGVPWARSGSGFTLLFEALLMAMVPAMPVNAVARQVGEHDTRLWRVLHHYVEQARANADASEVTRVAIDETAARRGHDYITLFVDIDQARVVFATDGKDAGTIAAFADDLTAHGGNPDAVSEVCIDMSPAFIKGTAESLPKAAVTFDKFHAVKIINEAVDQVRRAEQKSQIVLARYPLPLAAQSDQPVGPTARHWKACPRAISRRGGPIRSGSPFRNFMSNPPLRRAPATSRPGTSGPLTAGCRRSSMLPVPSSVIGRASCAGSTARSPMA